MEPEKVRSTNLENLLELIHSEGVLKTQAETEKLLDLAKTEAAGLVKDAQEKARLIEVESEKKAQQREVALLAGLKLAARDLELEVLERLQGRFLRFTQAQVEQALTPELMATLIQSVVSGADGPLSVEFGGLGLSEAEEALIQGFAKQLGQEVRLTNNPEGQPGFWVREEGKERFFEFSAEQIAQGIESYLSPKLKELWKTELKPRGDR